MDRLINYAFLLLLIFLFVLEAGADVRPRIGIALLAALFFSLLVFIMNWLTLDGAIAATVFGGIAFGVGGWEIAALILLFFITSTLLSLKSVVIIEETAQAFSERKRRDGIQVWANGFWMALCIIAGFVFEMDLFTIGAAAAISTATADTWATEMGSNRFGGKTYLITNFKTVKAGEEGGVSLYGTLAALCGSLMIAFASVMLFSISWTTSLSAVFLSGFLGCIADSYFGATFQRDDHIVNLGSDDSRLNIKLNNNFVNWAATGFGSLTAIIINLFLL
ncbi:DUF92 domain-containing protein [Aliifodinibius sp. S!AR15-10]|uniref:DUF92 domain-containing protein n=1 Tax=Aliifodinibius sp. S!AR15-10 TaxID=2950437 RepID=UPI00285AA1AB|nr:DUF92 domain-containing protein [Aliifodinibius sp. S!AR15-10]MDR8391797.1 DUF92 domain-containing protein [Aliifodinibius sp. S!AR15-10]